MALGVVLTETSEAAKNVIRLPLLSLDARELHKSLTERISPNTPFLALHLFAIAKGLEEQNQTRLRARYPKAGEKAKFNRVVLVRQPAARQQGTGAAPIRQH